MTKQQFLDIAKARRARRFGFGDAVAAVAKPIARGIDRLIGTSLENCGGCDGRRRWLNELGDRLRRNELGIPIRLLNRQSPGDIVVLTGVVRELHRQYPGRFLTAIDTTAAELWENNPHVVAGADAILDVPVTYEGIHQSNQSGKHFMQAMADDLAAALELPGLPIDDPRGDIYLTESERAEHPFDPPEPYWLVNAGVKSDYTAKAWPYYQQVVSAFTTHHSPLTTHHSPLTTHLNFVQVGQLGHDSGLTHSHAPLDGVAVNLLGRTNHRDLIHMVAHSSGVLCGVSYLMHLAAAFRKPCVVVAGGREPIAWNSYRYRGFHLLHTIGQLDCCASGGCWKSRTLPLGDDDENDKSLCARPERGFPACMRVIGPDRVDEIIISACAATSLT